MTDDEKATLSGNLVEELINIVEFIDIDRVTPDTPLYRCFDTMKQAARTYRSTTAGNEKE